LSDAIHYNGKLENRARLADLLDAARTFCADQRWGYLDVDERIIGIVERSDGDASETVPIDATMLGILITVDSQADPVCLTFNDANELAYYTPLGENEYWEIKSFTTGTRFKSVEQHVAVCELLHEIHDDYMPGLNVYDEGGYYESGDASQLESSSDEFSEEIDPEEERLNFREAKGRGAKRIRE